MWMEHLEREPENVTFYRHASEFLGYEDSTLRIELLRQGQRLDGTNPEWALDLGMWLSFEIEYPPGEGTIDIRTAEQALEQYERAYELLGVSGRGRALVDLAGIALLAGQPDKARKYAELMVSDQRVVGEWRSAQIFHNGNIVLGRLALTQGDLKEAKARLLRAVVDFDAPERNLLTPDFSLAEALLEQGQRKVVLKFFRLCSRFWVRGRSNLEDWTILVRKGRIPRGMPRGTP